MLLLGQPWCLGWTLGWRSTHVCIPHGGTWHFTRHMWTYKAHRGSHVYIGTHGHTDYAQVHLQLHMCIQAHMNSQGIIGLHRYIRLSWVHIHTHRHTTHMGSHICTYTHAYMSSQLHTCRHRHMASHMETQGLHMLNILEHTCSHNSHTENPCAHTHEFTRHSGLTHRYTELMYTGHT